MKIIDDIGDPTIVRAIERWGRRPDLTKFSITELVAPTRISALRRLHWDDIEQPASEMLFALMGSAMHEVLAKAGTGDELTEERMEALIGDSQLTGALDKFSLDDGGTLVDYKTTSTYAIEDGVKPEWEQQLNGYAMLLRKQGFKVTNAYIVAILRDWSRVKAEQDHSYPQKRMIRLEARLWPEGYTEEWYDVRAAQLRAACNPRSLEPDPLKWRPVCTPAERWAKPDTWAIQKPGAARATRVLNSETEAEVWRKDQKKPEDYEIKHRPGANTRCQYYCPVAKFCDWWQANKTNH